MKSFICYIKNLLCSNLILKNSLSVKFHIEESEIKFNNFYCQGWVYNEDIDNDLDSIIYFVDNEIMEYKLFHPRKDVKSHFNLKQNVYGFENYFSLKSSNVSICFRFKNRKLSKKNQIYVYNEDYQNTNFKFEFINRFKIFTLLIKIAFQHLKLNNFKFKYTFYEYYLKSKVFFENNRFDSKFDESSKFKIKQFNCIKKIKLNNNLRHILSNQVLNFKFTPKFTIIIPVYNPKIKFINELFLSLKNQIYKNFEVIFVDNGSAKSINNILNEFANKHTYVKYFSLNKNYGISYATNFGIKKSSGDYLVFIDHDDLITEDALFLAALELNNNRNIEWLYTDECKYDGKNIYHFQFKGPFSYAYLLNTNYIQHLSIVKKNILKSFEFNSSYDGCQDFQLNLFLSQNVNKNKIAHINKICYLWRAHAGSTAMDSSQKNYIFEKALLLLKDHLDKYGINADPYININAKQKGMLINNLKWHPFNETVTILIPNRNSHNLIDKCLNSINNTVDKKFIKIIIIDDCSTDKKTFYIYDKYKNNKFLSFKVIENKRKNDEFNYSELINYGSKFVDTKYFIQINNDIEAIEHGWVNQMLGWFSFENVKVVGVNLYYPNNSIQHAGVHIGSNGGLADHIFNRCNDNQNLYFGLNHLQRNVSAVTAACMMVDTEFFKKNNGFDEEKFKIQFNDVDFCLRTIKQNKQIILDTSIKLIHHESLSRGKDHNYHGHENFITKYNNYIDPYYNENFLVDKNDYSINFENNYYSNKIKLKNILIIIHELTMTGAPIVAFNLAKYLLSNSITPIILSLKDGPLKEQIIKHNIKVIVIERDTNFDEKLNDIKIKSKVLQKLTNVKFETIIFNSYSSIWHLHDIFDKKITKILNIHESITPNNFIKNEKKLKLLKDFDAIIFQSKQILRNFDPQNMFDNKYLIPGSLPVNEINKFKNLNDKSHLKKQYGFAKNDIIISNIGTVCPRKGQEIFIKAAVKFLKNHKNNSKYKFLVVGDNASSYSIYIKSFIPINLQKYFKFIDENPDVYNFYLLSDFFVCTSFQESFPMVILLAMFFELPIITTDVNGIPEMLHPEVKNYNNDFAVFIKPGDYIGLCNAFKNELTLSDKNKKRVLMSKSNFLRFYRDDIGYKMYIDLLHKLKFYS